MAEQGSAEVAINKWMERWRGLRNEWNRGTGVSVEPKQHRGETPWSGPLADTLHVSVWLTLCMLGELCKKGGCYKTPLSAPALRTNKCYKNQMTGHQRIARERERERYHSLLHVNNTHTFVPSKETQREKQPGCFHTYAERGTMQEVSLSIHST